MKQKVLFILTLICLSFSASAQIEVDGIYYILGDFAVVTHKGAYYYSYSNEYSGSVTIPPSVTYSGRTYKVTKIGDRAFMGCSGLTSVTIPNTVTEIESGAFNGCSGLTSVTIPNSVTMIGGGAFSGTSWLINQPNGLVYGGKAAYRYKGAVPSGTSVVIKEGTVSISPNCFETLGGLTSIEIPNSVTSIGKEAFRSCSVTSVTIGNSVALIGEYAFYGCDGLTSLTIPNSVTTIGGYAFYGCSGLTGALTIPNSVISIGGHAFEECSGLTSVTIGNSVKWIGAYAFHNYNHTSLKSVTIGNLVTSIGEWAFAGNTVIKNIYTYPNPANVALGDDVFYGVPKYAVFLHVTPEHFDAYKNASQWKEFHNIVDDLAGVEGVEVEEATKEVEGYYDLKGIRLNEPIRGQVTIVRYKDGSTKKIVVE